MVVERLGGETFLYLRIEGADMLVVQADGEIPTRVHDRLAVALNPASCHLFDGDGLAVERAERHPLADMTRPTARKAS
jgi:multiple sugar transport system ATP-binding protein